MRQILPVASCAGPRYGLAIAKMVAKTENEFYYLFANPKGFTLQSSTSVFFKTSNRVTAEMLCQLFKESFGSTHDFSAKPIAEFSLGDRIRCEEMLDLLEVYSEPDIGVYDPAPPKDVHQRAQFATQANSWLRYVDRTADTSPQTEHQEDRKSSSSSDSWNGIPTEERRNCGRILLWMLAQTYYKILDQTISAANMVAQLDLSLNQSYMWVVTTLGNLLKNHPDLRDFPGEFEPYFADLYPTTILDCEWEDGVGSHAEEFLSTAQRYVFEKGIYDPEDGSTGYCFVEMFRPSIDRALESANAYGERMRKLSKKAFARAQPPQTEASAAKSAPAPLKSKRFKVALTFAGERRYFVTAVAEHLATAFGKEKILYDNYHQAELARVDLDVHLQRLYHDESELIVIFVCSFYAEKQWCGLEWRALRDLIKQKVGNIIMPFRFDQTEVPGLFSTDGYISVDHRTPREIADQIIKRLQLNGS